MSQAYQPPPSGSGSGNQSSGAVAFEDTTKPVAYLCGDCDAKVILRRGDQIICRECGHRVLYKERTNR